MKNKMYTLSNIKRYESKPDTPKVWKKIVATIQDGTEITIWDKFPNFDSLKDGDTVQGDLTVGEWNGKKQHTLNPLRTPMKGNSGIANAMKKKEESITKFQDNKAESIKMSSTFRDATLLTTTFGSMNGTMTDEEIKATWTVWREWLLKNYDVDNSQPPF